MVSDYRSFSLLRQAGPPGLLLATPRCGACGGGLHFKEVLAAVVRSIHGQRGEGETFP